MADLEPTQPSADVLAGGDSEQLRESAAASDSDGATPTHCALVADNNEDMMGDAMDVQPDSSGDSAEDMLLVESEPNVGKRVKVYELRDQAWFDRGTGHCRGVYDDRNDVALLMVEAEDPMETRQGEEAEGPGGFLKDELLLNTQVSKEEQYSRQQETLIVWTDHSTHQDIALSFQDPEGCEDIWQFIVDVQKHLNNQLGDDPKLAMSASSSPLATSPLLGGAAASAVGVMPREWQPPTLANIKEHEMWLRMQAKSTVGRERAVEHIIGEDYIKQLIGVLHQAEDLESIGDLHALCSLMQTILMFNDNGIFEYILQDDIFMGVLGMLEYDPEFPTLKASYRAFFRRFSKYREVVQIKDETIRNKIHQTSRLLYLKDVVLARMLDDPTFGILNSFVFFNQVDITAYIQSDDDLLHDLFVEFRRDQDDATKEPKRRDLVLFLHQLMVMGKGLQVPPRLTLYRILLDRGLLFACEWAFRQREAVILHAGAEILTLAVEHDVNAVRLHVLREEEVSRRTLVMEIIGLLQTTNDQGLIQQMVETLKTLLEPGAEPEQSFGRAKELSVVETFTQYFYDFCATPLFAPITELPELKESKGFPVLTTERTSLLCTLVDLLSYYISVHGHRAQYFILSNPLAQKVCSMLYAREKTLRHSALRFVKACLKTNNHFIHRNFAKNAVTKAVLDIVDRETDRDTMLSSACLDTIELIRKENMKPIIIDMFDKYEPTMSRLAERPYLRSYILGLRARWEQFKEPPPPPPPQVAENTQGPSAADEEEAWFNQSDDEDTETSSDAAASGSGTSGSSHVPAKRKRHEQPTGSPSAKRQSTATAGAPALGLDYDDASDSEGSADGTESPKGRSALAPFDSELADELTDVEQKIRAKRMRQEEEEEDGAFASLLGAKSAGKSASDKKAAGAPPATAEKASVKSEEKEPGSAAGSETGMVTDSGVAADVKDGQAATGKASTVTGGKEKKIRLSLGVLGKKLHGDKV